MHLLGNDIRECWTEDAARDGGWITPAGLSVRRGSALSWS